MKVFLGLVLVLWFCDIAVAKEKVRELSKGSVPAGHVSVFCISGYKVASAAFCGAQGCGITMIQLVGKNNQPISCK